MDRLGYPVHTDEKLSERIDNDFKPHNCIADQKRAMDNLTTECRLLAHSINLLVPNGREKSTALTNLEQVMFFANAGIARQGEPITGGR